MPLGGFDIMVGMRRHLIVGIAMVAVAGLAPGLKPSPKAAANQPKLDAAIPQSFGDWKIDPTIVPILPAPDVQANLEKTYDQIVNRTYINNQGERIMLTLAYGGDQSDALKAHRQEVCYAAQGFEIRALKYETLGLAGRQIPITRMLAVQGLRSEPVTYWLTMGDRVVQGRLERLIVQLRYGLGGEIPDGIMVRVSNISGNPQEAYRAQEQFMQALLVGIRPADVPLLVGKSTL
jgi:EpsI family protein